MENKNFIAAMLLSALILIGFQFFYVKPQQHGRDNVPVTANEQPAIAPAADAAVLRERAQVLSDNPRVAIRTPALTGSIDLKGARFDDLQLIKYKETVADTSPPVTLLSPAGSQAPYNAYYADFSWLASDPGTSVPTAQSEWKATGGELTPDQPVTLNWSNGQGLTFTRQIAVDDHYLFTVTDHVANTGNAPVTLYPYGLLLRQGDPVVRSSNVLHEGPLGVLDGTLSEYKYKKLIDIGKATQDSTGGWLGITDKYWLVAMIPPQDERISADFAFNGAGVPVPEQGKFQTDFRGTAVTVAPGGSADHVAHLFAGAKHLRRLDTYGKQLNLPHFDRAIDFGWFYFLTKPFLYLLNYLGTSLGSFGIAILVFTVMLKLITLPLSLKSNHSMSRMKVLQPQIKALQERFKDDKIKQNQEMMELFKKEKVSPMSGCLPTLIQIPIFFALYKVLYVGIELRQAPFFGWIRDMSAPDPTSVFTLFGAIPWTPPAGLHIGIWPILMGCSMFAQQRLSPQPPDKGQARMFMFMPILFTYMLANMPSGLVIYWTWSNLLSILQQWFIMSRDMNRPGRKVKDTDI